MADKETQLVEKEMDAEDNLAPYHEHSTLRGVNWTWERGCGYLRHPAYDGSMDIFEDYGGANNGTLGA